MAASRSALDTSGSRGNYFDRSKFTVYGITLVHHISLGLIMDAHDYDEASPVLVIGGGLAGLSAAVFLGLRGIRAVVAERHPATSVHPRARGQVRRPWRRCAWPAWTSACE